MGRKVGEAEKSERQKTPDYEIAHRKELRHWLRTGEQGPVAISRSTPPTIVSTWLNHTCRACAR